jgi:AbrB family looped-hinge helix DNA binding protein
MLASLAMLSEKNISQSDTDFNSISRVQKKGQVTIPVFVRNLLSLDPGDRVKFVIKDNGDVVLRAVTFIDTLHAIEGIEQYLRDNNITVDDLNKISESVQDRLFEEMYGDL